MKITIAILALSLFSISVHAQEREPSQMLVTSGSIFCVAGNVADLITTRDVLNAGGHESNTTLNGSSFPRIAATKAITVGLTVVAMKVLAAHGHPKIAAVLGFGSGFVGFGAAYHNVGQVK